MGMLQELNDISYTLDQKRRAREQKEQQKAIEKLYYNELKSNLRADFYDNFTTYGLKEGYKKSILQKDMTLDFIYNLLYNYSENIDYKKIYIFRKFDIMQDLENNYYKILNIVKSEFIKQNDILTDELLEKLKAFLIERLDNAPSKKIAIQVLTDKKYIDYTINYITQDQEQKDILYNNYNKVLNDVKKLYLGNIEQEREQEREKKQYLKIQKQNRILKRADRLYTLHLINTLLNKIK